MEKTLILGTRLRAGGEAGDRMKRLDGIIDSMDMNLSKLQEIVKDREAWHAAEHGVTRVRHDLAVEQYGKNGTKYIEGAQ